MKVIIYLFLIYLSMVYCHHTTDNENQRRDENFISPEHSIADNHEYDAFEREARRKLENKKSTESFKRIPAVRRVVPGDDEYHNTEQKNKEFEKRLHQEEDRRHHEENNVSDHAVRRVPGDDEYHDTEHKNKKFEKRLHHEEDADPDRNNNLPDTESDHVDYQPQGYPLLPFRPSSAPPVVFFGPQPSGGRRQIHLPVYRRPSYPRLYDVAPVPVSYRTINPVAYSVPRVRNVVLGYPTLPSPVRYAYSAPSAAFDNGAGPVEYRGYIAEEYDDFLKKK